MRSTIINLWGRIKIPLFILSALIPLLGLFKSPADPLLPIYTVFSALFFIKKRFYRQEPETNITSGSNIKFAFLIVAVGLTAESLAWGVNFLAKSENPTLFHPQLFYDLIISLAMYSSWAIVWFFWSKKYAFSLTQVFILQGVYGILLEQKGAIFIQGLLNMPIGILFWAYVFVVYGSITCLAYLLSGKVTVGESPKLITYILILLSLFVISIILMLAWGLLLQVLGIIPQPQPIWEKPLW